MEDVRQTLYSLGWAQGKCLRVVDVPELLQIASEIAKDDDPNHCVGVCVLYDCALINPSFDDEPYAAFVVLRRLEESAQQGSYLNGKDPRKLHIPLSNDGQEVYYEVVPKGFIQLERRKLLELTPSKETNIGDQNLHILTHWLARRFRTPSYPDSFNERLVKKNVERFFKKYDDLTTGVYINIDPKNEELPSADVYKVGVIVAVHDQRLRTLAKEGRVDEIKMAVSNLFSDANSFKLDFNDVIEEGAITLKILREYTLWSPEYYTHRSEAEDLPVETTGSGTC